VKMSLRAPRPLSLLVAMHLPFFAFATIQSVTGVAWPDPGTRWSALPLVLCAAAIQLRHSLAAARGARPRYWQWTLLLLVLLTYVPYPLLGGRWSTLHWFVIASYLMLLPWPTALAAGAIDAAGIGAYGTWALSHGLFFAAFGSIVMFAGGAGLYGAARLVWHADDLRATRAEIAELAVERERLRISRDLHDLLGHSLSAVALKGDLAHGLIEREEIEQAAAEIQSLVSVARTALHDLREIVYQQPAVSLISELDRCSDILAAVGIETRISKPLESLPGKIDELFAWVVREGVTNVMRHSTATACSISIGRGDGRLRLEIENDGAGAMSPSGQGLSGLAARAAELSGKMQAQVAAVGHFVLVVDVPEEAT